MTGTTGESSSPKTSHPILSKPLRNMFAFRRKCIIFSLPFVVPSSPMIILSARSACFAQPGDIEHAYTDPGHTLRRSMTHAAHEFPARESESRERNSKCALQRNEQFG